MAIEVPTADVDRMTAIRKALRRVVSRLPEREQLLIRRATAAVRGLDWAAAVSRLRQSEAQFIDDTVAQHRGAPGTRRVLVCLLQQLPPVAEVSYSLATALRLRGHEVRGILCDGILPMCEMNLGELDRPPCGVCATWASRFEAACGFSFTRLTALLSPTDLHLAEQRVASVPDDGLTSLMIDDVPVGVLARRELQRYHRGFVFHPERDPAYRRWLVSGALLVTLARRLFDQEQPDVLVISSGRTLLAACLTAVARAMGVRTVSWDLEDSHRDGLVFSHGAPAVELPLDDAWAHASSEPLSGEQREVLGRFLGRWSRSEGTPFQYNLNPQQDPAAIKSQLGLRPDAPLIVAFANAAWDMAAVDRDVGFRSMFEWLFSVIDYALAHPEIDLVVRAHPAEINVPSDLRSRTRVVSEIRQRYPDLPSRITLLEGNSSVSSYTLAELAQVPMMYATRLGLELAVRGRRAWLAGQTTYRERGFTRDVGSRREMEALLDARTFNEVLSAGEIAQAERFAYLWFFRYVVRLPLLRPPTRKFALSTFRELAPGGHPVVDRIAHAIVTGAPFLDLAQPFNAAP
jgi:hypothetical protein